MKSAPVLTRALVFGAIVTVAVAVFGSIVGVIVAGLPGLVSALLGAGLTALFLGATTLSIVLAQRATRDRPSSGTFFGIVLGMWVLKFVVFVIVLILVRDQPWLNAYVFFFAMVAAVIGSLITDIIALQGAHVSHVPVDGL